jgi:hypothetical protein
MRMTAIEDMRDYRRTDVFALPQQHGYTANARGRQNVAPRRIGQG